VTDIALVVALADKDGSYSDVVPESPEKGVDDKQDLVCGGARSQQGKSSQVECKKQAGKVDAVENIQAHKTALGGRLLSKHGSGRGRSIIIENRTLSLVLGLFARRRWVVGLFDMRVLDGG
jgi:hypothetical protein